MAGSRADYVDPAIILAVRDEIKAGNVPVLARLDSIDARLGAGSVDIALLKQRVEDCEKRPATEPSERKPKPSLWDRFGMAILIGIASGIGALISAGLTHAMTAVKP